MLFAVLGKTSSKLRAPLDVPHACAHRVISGSLPKHPMDPMDGQYPSSDDDRHQLVRWQTRVARMHVNYDIMTSTGRRCIRSAGNLRVVYTVGAFLIQ